MEFNKDKYPVIDVEGVISSGKQYDIDITLPEDNRSVIYGIIKDAYDEPVRDAVVIAYCTNEAISIIENAGLMGVPIPTRLTKAIEALKSKEDDNNENC